MTFLVSASAGPGSNSGSRFFVQSVLAYVRAMGVQPGDKPMSNVTLSEPEIRMLIQSLDHCLATCHNEKTSGKQACSDCEAAKALRQKLDSQLA